MKRLTLNLAALTLLPLASLALVACSNNGAMGTEQETMLETPDGAAIVDTLKINATITAIDAPSRKVTITQADGSHRTVKCGPDVVNFDQLAVGDKVNVTVTEELAVFLSRGTPPSAAGATGVVLAPLGAKPGGIVANTVQVTAKITAINTKNRHVTLALPDGTTDTVKADKPVDLSAVNVGDDVTVQQTEMLAITVEKA